MVDTSGMADIAGLNITTIVKGFADEQNVFKKFCTQITTPNIHFRWWQKTSGFLDSTDTTAITASQIANAGFLARPDVAEQSWTVVNSYVKKYIIESPWFAEEDIKDSSVALMVTNMRDLTRAVQRQVDQRIINVLTESYTPVNIQSVAATADGWDDDATGNPIKDLLNAKQLIRSQGYDPEGAVCAINSIDYRNLVNFIISVKGSSIPALATQTAKDGVVMGLAGLQIVVSENVTTDYAIVFVPKVAATWAQYMGIQSAVITEPGIARKVRIWEEGECILTDPKAVCLITDTVV